MKNEPMATLPVETPSECYALIYNRSSDALFLRNAEAVIAIGSFTSEQYRRLDSEFKKRYTETKAKKKHVVFVLEQTEYALCLPDIPESVPRYTIDDLHKQNESILGYLKTIAEILAASIDNKLENDDAYGHKNVEEPIVTTSIGTKGTDKAKRKPLPSGGTKERTPKGETIDDILGELVDAHPEWDKWYTGTIKELADLVALRRKDGKCSETSIKTSSTWTERLAPMRKKARKHKLKKEKLWGNFNRTSDPQAEKSKDEIDDQIDQEWSTDQN